MNLEKFFTLAFRSVLFCIPELLSFKKFRGMNKGADTLQEIFLTRVLQLRMRCPRHPWVSPNLKASSKRLATVFVKSCHLQQFTPLRIQKGTNNRPPMISIDLLLSAGKLNKGSALERKFGQETKRKWAE